MFENRYEIIEEFTDDKGNNYRLLKIKNSEVYALQNNIYYDVDEGYEESKAREIFNKIKNRKESVVIPDNYLTNE